MPAAHSSELRLATDTDTRPSPRARLGPSTFALVLFGIIALAVFIDIRLSLALVSYTPVAFGLPDQGWLDGLARWDSGWYYHIATKGYFYDGPNRQSAVAFFPAYPSAMRALGVVVGDTIIAGILVTLASGAGAAVLFFRWCRAAFNARTARLGLALLLLYPFSFYLFGAVYSDALFLLAVLGAFVLLEHDRPVLAGLAGMIATAARPVGIALVVGLVLRALEARLLPNARPHFFRPREPLLSHSSRSVGRIDWRQLRVRDAGVVLSALGLVAFAAYLWWRFQEPLAFTKVSGSPGWNRVVTWDVVIKVNFFQRWRDYGLNIVNFWVTAQGLVTLLSLAAVPAIVRRLGWGYGAYVLITVGLAAASSMDFVGMGRYVLVAFPVFAVVADTLSRASERRRVWLPAGVLIVSGALLAWMASLYARYYFLA